MTLSVVDREVVFIEVVPRIHGFAVLWHVANSVTNVTEGEDFTHGRRSGLDPKASRFSEDCIE